MQFLKKLAMLVALPLVVACSDSNNNSDSATEAAQLRLTHASPDAPAVNVYVDGELALERVEFKQSSGLLNLDAGSTEVEVRGLLPDGSELSVIGPVALDLQEGVRTDVLAVGKLLDAQGGISIAAQVLDPLEVTQEIDDVRVTLVHAAPEAGQVDIYVTAPEGALADTAPISAAFGDAAGPVSLMPDTAYRVRITPASSSMVVFDSGTLSFPAGTELVIAAVENTYGLGGSPVTLLAVGAEGASEVLDGAMGGAVRVVHNSADTPPVDVLVDGAEVLDAVPFASASSYSDIEAPAGTYNVVVAADADNSIAPIDIDLTINPSESYTAIAVGSFAESTIEAILTMDDRRKLATAAVVEVIHGSYLVAAEIPVDVYLTPDGVIADAEPAIAGLAYGETTGQLQLAPGEYWVTVTAAGDKAVVAFDSGAALALDAGVNYTVIARDPDPVAADGSPLINVILLAD